MEIYERTWNGQIFFSFATTSYAEQPCEVKDFILMSFFPASRPGRNRWNKYKDTSANNDRNQNRPRQNGQTWQNNPNGMHSNGQTTPNRFMGPNSNNYRNPNGYQKNYQNG